MNDFITTLMSRLASTFDPVRAGEVAADVVAGALVGVLVFAAYWALWSVLNIASKPILRRLEADATSAAFTGTVLKYSVLGVGLIHALDSGGINTAGILASLGVLGLTIGFAARDALSNVVSGILIFWDRPFVLGDLVEIDGQYGRVDRITLRSTRVVTPNGRMMAVPNTSVINTTVASYTNFPHLRIDVPVTVGVDEDLGRVRQILLGLVQDEKVFMSAPKPQVSLLTLGDYNVEVQLEAWIYDERKHMSVRAALRESVYEALRGAGVDMPFETLQIRPLEVRTQTA